MINIPFLFIGASVSPQGGKRAFENEKGLRSFLRNLKLSYCAAFNYKWKHFHCNTFYEVGFNDFDNWIFYAIPHCREIFNFTSIKNFQFKSKLRTSRKNGKNNTTYTEKFGANSCL